MSALQPGDMMLHESGNFAICRPFGLYGGRHERARRTTAMTAAIWVDPARQSGSPCINGTRIPVSTVAHWVEHENVDSFMRRYAIESRRPAKMIAAIRKMNAALRTRPPLRKRRYPIRPISRPPVSQGEPP